MIGGIIMALEYKIKQLKFACLMKDREKVMELKSHCDECLHWDFCKYQSHACYICECFVSKKEYDLEIVKDFVDKIKLHGRKMNSSDYTGEFWDYAVLLEDIDSILRLYSRR